MTTLQPYLKHIASGVDWLGGIPTRWNLVRMKHVFNERIDKGFPDEPLLAATQTQGVVTKDRFESRTVVATKDLELLKMVREGDFVISLRSFEGGIEYAWDQGIISPAYTILTPNCPSVSHYFRWLFKSKPYIENLSLHVTGIREGQNINYVRLARSIIPLPPSDEQRAIADFLDVMDARITRFIAARRRMIALLEEQKQAIINKAVTRGLDPDVPLKPSGVEWLGDIPAHWEIKSLRRECINLNTKRVPLSSEVRGQMHERKYDYYGASGVIDKVAEYLFDDELLLIAEDGANLVFRNLPLAIVARGKFWVNNHAHILKPRGGCLEFFAYLLEAIDYRPWITGAAQPKLTQDRLMSIRLPIPPTIEQRQIATHVSRLLSESKQVADRCEREISLVREYRTRLTSDVVTGKLDVRDVELPAIEEIVDERLTLQVDPTKTIGLEFNLSEESCSFGDEV